MIVTILGRRWNLRYVPNLGDKRGDCDAPNKPGKEIRVWQGVKDDQEFLEVVAHECLHAAHWSIDEEFVTRFAEDLARILTKLGYSRSKQA